MSERDPAVLLALAAGADERRKAAAGTPDYILRGGPKTTEAECSCGWTVNTKRGSGAALELWQAHVRKTHVAKPFESALADLGVTVHTTDKNALLAWLDSPECQAWEDADPLNDEGEPRG